MKGYLVLCYHYLRQEKSIDPFPRIFGNSFTQFQKHIQMLQEIFTSISPEVALNFSYAKSHISKKDYGVLFTFDDGLSDHYEGAKILADNKIQGIFFVPTCILTEKMPANPMIIHYSIAIFGITKFLSEYQNALTENKINSRQFNITFNPQQNNIWKKIDEIKSVFKYKLDYKKSRKILLTIYKNLLLNNQSDFLNKIHLTHDQIKEMIEMGHSIGVHTHTHVSVAAHKLTPEDFKKEIIEPKEYLEKEFKIQVNYFSYPYGEKKDFLPTEKFLKKTNHYKLAFTVENIVNTIKTPSFELGRYQPTKKETDSSLRKILKNILKE